MLPERIAAKIEQNEAGCWLWTDALHVSGYAYAKLAGRRVHAHRLVYSLLVGEIPEGMQLDHLCRVRHCVNPEHLEPVTNQENARRRSALITHCPQGHEYTEANTIIWADGKRRCRTCDRARDRGTPPSSAERLARDPEGYRASRREQMRRYRARKRAD